METKRLFLAFFLSTLILIVWNSIFGQRESDIRSREESEVAEKVETIREENQVRHNQINDEEREQKPEPEVRITADAEELINLENDRLKLVFSNRGAQLRSSQLLNYTTGDEKYALEMVRKRGVDPYPFGLVTVDMRSHELNKALFASEVTKSDNGNKVIQFVHSSELGSARKSFELNQDGFLKVNISVAGEQGWSTVLGPGVRELTPGESDNRYIQKQAGYKRLNMSDTIPSVNQDAEEIIPAHDLVWVSLEDNFFLIGVVPQSGLKEAVVRPIAVREELTQETDSRFLEVNSEQQNVSKDQLVLLRAQSDQFGGLVFFGSKRYKRLVDLPFSLEETVRWGWFALLVKPLYFSLEWIHDHLTNNYGWAIILVTCLLRVAFFPLTYKSQMSMAKMQELNPEIQAIRNRYRAKLKNRQGRPNMEAQRLMNEEIMQIYRKSGVNPASGCLPILLQMPVFFAFFKLLTTSVELRNAPWLGWIKDLSTADPYWILPIVMGASSVYMQRLMPATPDPMQRKIMQAMPLFFMVFAFYMPSGLVLYWIMNNILSMVQQVGMNRLRKR